VSWRSTTADPKSPGHIVAIGGEEFLTTDGNRGLSRWRWPVRQEPKEEKSRELPDRIATAPLVLSGSGELKTVCVADVRGAVRLLRASDLTTIREWQLKGEVTAGPFRLGPSLGCILDQERLVVLDPSRDGPLWDHASPGEKIVGQPQLIGDVIVVANLSGRFFALDRGSGQRHAGEIRLQASVAPAASPVAFGKDRFFAPLTDGTVLLLSRKELR
jgi:hypothetical protein